MGQLGWVLKQFRKINIEERAVGTFQDNTAEIFDVLTRVPILDGQLVTASVNATGVNKVEHKLGREYRGWIAVDCEAQNPVISFWASQGATDKDKFIYVDSDTDTTVTFWVF